LVGDEYLLTTSDFFTVALVLDCDLVLLRDRDLSAGLRVDRERLLDRVRDFERARVGVFPLLGDLVFALPGDLAGDLVVVLPGDLAGDLLTL